MSDTLTAPAPVASGTPVAPASTANPAKPTPAPSFTDAGAALKQAKSWADVPGLTPDPAGVGEAVSGGEDDEPPPEQQPEGQQAAPETPTGDQAPEFVQDAEGKWHRADGTFATVDEIAQIDAELAAQAADDTAKAEQAKQAELAAKANTVTLRRRDGTTRDVIVDDPELAEEIRANYNDGMRGKDFREKAAAVDAKLAQFKQLDALLDTNPEAFVAQSLSPEQKVRLATQLLAEHFDELVPIIQGFDQNPSERIKTTAEAQRRLREQQSEFNTLVQAQAQAKDVRMAVEALLPEALDHETAGQFWADASADLQRAIARGEAVTAQTVPALLQSRLKLYGITAPAGQASASVPRVTLASPAQTPPATGTTPAASTGNSSVAQPANDAAKALADAERTQRRIRLTQAARSRAAAVPPAGAGAAPLRLPPVAPNASIEEASQSLKKLKHWTS